MSLTNERRQVVRDTAGQRCEYCRLFEDERYANFQIDHIILLKHGGKDTIENLCLACLKCNGFKGPNVAALDPETGDATKLFNPRRQQWADHFRINQNATLAGLTPEGRATIIVLRINEERRVENRQLFMVLGEYPCEPP